MMTHADLFEFTYPEELYLIEQPVTVVIATNWKSLKENEIELLTKILNSVKLNLAGVRIVEAASLNLSEWVEKPKRLIGFGVKVPGVNFYELISTPHTQLVLADELGVLHDQDELKKKLWIALKQQFFG